MKNKKNFTIAITISFLAVLIVVLSVVTIANAVEKKQAKEKELKRIEMVSKTPTWEEAIKIIKDTGYFYDHGFNVEEVIRVPDDLLRVKGTLSNISVKYYEYRYYTLYLGLEYDENAHEWKWQVVRYL